jgi:hypothetical protein
VSAAPGPVAVALVRELADAHLADAALRLARVAALVRDGDADQVQLRATHAALAQAACDFCTTYGHHDEWTPRRPRYPPSPLAVIRHDTPPGRARSRGRGTWRQWYNRARSRGRRGGTHGSRTNQGLPELVRLSE